MQPLSADDELTAVVEMTADDEEPSRRSLLVALVVSMLLSLFTALWLAVGALLIARVWHDARLVKRPDDESPGDCDAFLFYFSLFTCWLTISLTTLALVVVLARYAWRCIARRREERNELSADSD